MVIKAYCAEAAAPLSVTGDCGLRTVDHGLLTRCNTTSRFWQYFGLKGTFKTG